MVQIEDIVRWQTTVITSSIIFVYVMDIVSCHIAITLLQSFIFPIVLFNYLTIYPSVGRVKKFIHRCISFQKNQLPVHRYVNFTKIRLLQKIKHAACYITLTSFTGFWICYSITGVHGSPFTSTYWNTLPSNHPLLVISYIVHAP